MKHFLAAVPAQINPQLCNCRGSRRSRRRSRRLGAGTSRKLGVATGDKKVWTLLAGKLDLFCGSGLGKLVRSRKVGTCLEGLLVSWELVQVKLSVGHDNRNPHLKVGIAAKSF